MPENTQPSPWFALTVKPRHEKAAAGNLRVRGLEDFLPLYRARRRWSDRTQTVEMPLFPGYVFCRFDRRERLHALSTPGITSVVGFAGAAAPIGDAEIDSIRAVLRSGLRVEPYPYLKAGERIRIEDGALAGVQGTVVREKGGCRVVINVELLQRSVAVEVDRETLTAIR